MTDDDEYAGAKLRGSGFPHEWGIPQGSAYSATRAAWVRDNVLRHMTTAEIRRRVTAGRAATTRLAQIIARRYAPGDGPGQR
ncbi:MAG: hypothetical protein M3Q71_22285 [Chloroflexota bacterium]|nr:hypothetical protein [Chloroflexota bacterium]